MTHDEIEKELIDAISVLQEVNDLKVQEVVYVVTKAMTAVVNKMVGLEPCPNCGHYDCDLNCPGT